MIFFVYLALMLVLEVIETIATLSLSTRLEVSQEVIIGGVTTSHLLHRDELLILDEEDAVAVAGEIVININFTEMSLTSCSS